MSDATYGIDIVGNDRTAKGAKSAEKRLAAIPKRAGAAGQRYAQESERSLRRHTRSIVRTFSEVEQAGARVFGGRSITSGISGRLGGISAAARAAGTGLGEAAAAGGVLEGTLGAVGVAAGATVGILAAAGYAAFKLADGWAKGAASIGRTAQIIGVSTTALTEFTAAAERAGVDKGTSAGSLGGLSQTLNDARYGRNPGAQALLAKLGVGMKLKGDGTVDVEAMLPALADAMQRQNSSGARTVASGLGISEAMIPFLRQGGTSLRSEMKDAGQHAATLSDADAAIAQRIARKSVMVGQLGERLLSKAGRSTAEAAEPGYDGVLAGGQRLMDGASNFRSVVQDSFRPAAEKIDRAASRMERAGGVASRTGIGITGAAIAAAQGAERKYGVPASITLAQYKLESGAGRHMPRGSNNPFGIKARPGEPFVEARTREEDRVGRSYYTTARFRKYASLQEAFEEHAKLLATGKPYARARRQLPDVDAYADALTGTYATDRQYGSKLKNIISRDGMRQFDGATIPIKVEIDAKGLPAGTKTKVTAGGGRPAISYSYTPVHGG